MPSELSIVKERFVERGIEMHPKDTVKQTRNSQLILDEDDLSLRDDEDSHLEMATRETRAVHFLRAVVIVFLGSTAILVCVLVFIFARDAETIQYEQEYKDSISRIIDAFHGLVERKLGADNSLSTQITSFALSTNKTFPFVTLPDYVVRGADLRIQSDTPIVHWLPLVTDDKRLEWEEYALQNRFHIDSSFEADQEFRNRQDELFGLLGEGNRNLQANAEPPGVVNETILDEESGYHLKLWSIGALAPRGDCAPNTGPYLPLWQRSPVSPGKPQSQLNMNFAQSRAIAGALEVMLETKTAVMNPAAFPIPATLALFRANLESSQYRHDVESVLTNPATFFTYPVFDTFEEERNLVGVLATNIYWSLLFRKVVQPSTNIICVMENSFNQTFSYLLEGPEVIYLGEGDLHDTRFDHLGQFADISSQLAKNTEPETRSYTSVLLNREYGMYTLRVYPAYAQVYSNRPVIYTSTMALTFLFTSVIFVLYSIAVERRQRIVMNSAIHHAKKAADTAHELNEFLSHEVRNPLSAALSASTFVDTSLRETHCITDQGFHEALMDDVKIISSSLSFVSDFLRSMLDLHRAESHRIELQLAPIDMLKDILEPISNMFYQRSTGVKIEVDCPPNLLVVTDRIRLKQVILNLGRNAAKFVTSGFVRFRAMQGNGEKLLIYVEDSGPGIPEEKRYELFQKFQPSLDLLSQGTGIGLSLCKNLVRLLNGDLWLDVNYDSGIEGCPGARFVIQLPFPPIVESSEEDIPEPNNESVTKVEVDSTPPIIADKDIVLPDHLTVLFVDDDLVLRKLFMRAIKKVAPTWTVHEAANGETAIHLADEKHFDIIFVDQYMPSTEKSLLGTETIRELRAKGVTSCLCGLSANNLEHAFVEAGANGFIQKPMPCQKEELTRELWRLTCDMKPHEPECTMSSSSRSEPAEGDS